MKSLIVRIALLILAGVTICCAQDSSFRPKGQQIPVPACLTMKGLWEGGSKPCSQTGHPAWLADITHWRARTSYSSRLRWCQVRSARLGMDAIEFHAAPDDGAGSVLL